VPDFEGKQQGVVPSTMDRDFPDCGAATVEVGGDMRVHARISVVTVVTPIPRPHGMSVRENVGAVAGWWQLQHFLIALQRSSAGRDDGIGLVWRAASRKARDVIPGLLAFVARGFRPEMVLVDGNRAGAYDSGAWFTTSLRLLPAQPNHGNPPHLTCQEQAVPDLPRAGRS
jgi:hypothetical protein